MMSIDPLRRRRGRCGRGGVYLFDTINRTRLSRLLAIRVAQEWRWTRVMDADLHDWDMFIRPAELMDAMARHGLELRGTVGLGPHLNPVSTLFRMRATRQGRLTYGELSREQRFGPVRSKALSYMGHAVRL
jgi:2-polyprenyl-6-hydroxyphenyl methylase/3-demethylubiquinone-9 3-methyltransferase